MAKKSVVRSAQAPAPFAGAPYSQAIRVGDLVFVSGQIPLRPGSTELVGKTISEQTEQVLANLRAILEEAGRGLDRLVPSAMRRFSHGAHSPVPCSPARAIAPRVDTTFTVSPRPPSVRSAGMTPQKAPWGRSWVTPTSGGPAA